MIKHNSKLTILLFLFISAFAQAQIVSIEPVFFTVDDEITVTYDATQGNAGLVDVDVVYMHTGLITESGGPGNWNYVQGNWGQDDPKVRMTNIGNNKHTLTFTIRSFYSLPDNQTVTELAFVFRNVNGSKEGKTADLGDIFVGVPADQGFTAFFSRPGEDQVLVQLNETIDVKIDANEMAEIILYDNDQIVEQVTGTSLQTLLTVDNADQHIIRFEARAVDNNELKEDEFKYVVVKENTVAELPENTKLGLNIIDDQSAILALYAPLKDYVFVLGDFNDFSPDADYQMNITPDNTTWWLRINNLDPAKVHLYQYLVDGNLKIADPYSYLILDDRNDQWIEEELESVPAAYPSDLTSGHLSVLQTSPEIFNWTVDDFQAPEANDLVVYEVLLRDFLADHSYKSMIDTLDYLEELGVNTIELMPVSEFENNDSWGYNPSYHMALDKYYGSPKDFKRFVDEAHKRGIAVILDIVYNHAFGQSPLVRMWWDGALNKPSTDSPYFNPDAKHPFNVGFDFNHDSEATQQYVKQTLAYWTSEYRIDGYRFDLSKGFTQRQSSNNNVFSAYDAERIATLKDYGDDIWNSNEDAILILEHFANNTEEKELSENGFLLWGNANFNFNEGTMGYTEDGKSDFGHLLSSRRGFTKPHLMGYMESHDEERLMYKNAQFGNSSGGYNVKDLSTSLDRVELAAAFFFMIPGPKMIWQFGEMGYDFSINRCTNGTVNEDCRLSRKPIRWDYLEQEDRRDVISTFSKMIALKTSHPAVGNGSEILDVRNQVKRIELSDPAGDIIVIGNFGVTNANINPNFTREGTWYNYLTKEEIQVTNTSENIELAPGEFFVYIDNQDYLTSVINLDQDQNQGIDIYPNPSNGNFNISIDESLHQSQLFQYQIYDLQGKLLQADSITLPGSINIDTLNKGLYFLRLKDQEDRVFVKRLVLQK
jgi:glycosidase